MPRYAEIDQSGKCFSISFLAGEEHVAHLIPISDTDIQTGDVYSDGIWTRNETIRIDDNTVADVSYQFDVQAGDYVETGRTTRAEPLPPEPETDAQKIARLETELAKSQTDTLNTMSALADTYEQLLTVQDQQTALMDELRANGVIT